MSKGLEKIVASLELCKQIPAGEFEDAALVWDIHGKFDKWHVEKRVNRSVRFGDYGIMSPPHADISAPTLAEILEKLPEDEFEPDGSVATWLSMDRVPEAGSKEWAVGHNKYPESYRMEDENPANAALRLWLKLKGIEVK